MRSTRARKEQKTWPRMAASEEWWIGRVRISAFVVRNSVFHGEKFTVPQHGLQRGDAGVGAQHEDAVVARFFRQLAGVDLEGGTGGARSLAGAAEVAAVGRVADERLVARGAAARDRR